MPELNPRAVIGGNSPPDPIDTALAPFSDILLEVENWLDGDVVKTEGQLAATDILLKEMKAAKKAVDAARDEVTKPLHEAWKSEVARWKPTQDDLDRQVKCIIAAQAPYKAKLDAEKAEAARLARVEADRIADEARKAHLAAKASSIEEQRKADDLLKAAEEAARLASRASKDTVKGMRTVQVYEIESHKLLLHWIVKHDRDSVTAFIEEWARLNHKSASHAEGLKVWTEKRAF